LKNHLLSRKGFTLVELLVVVGIITAMAAIIAPVGKGMMIRSRTIHCSQNLRQIGMATMLYAGDNNMTLPATSHQRRQGGKSWTLTLQPYASGKITFKCANDEDPAREYTYVINDFLTPGPPGAPDIDYSRLSKVESPAKVMLFAEASVSYKNSDHFHFSEYRGRSVPPEVFASQVAVERHGGKSNYLFADGHVETFSWIETKRRLSAGSSSMVDPTVR
jgi:prepilin-type processing-associated H-X9-DG protein/prepilin-type N-terminal cleavage/methylation domain-containing protein